MFATMILFAALFYSLGGYFMKLSNGFTAVAPTTLVIALFALGASLQAVAMREEQMTITAIVGLGLEALITLLLGTFLLKESTLLSKVVGIGLVLGGILLLRFGKA